MNPRPRVWPSVQKLLGRRWPDLREHYRQVLFDKACRGRYLAELKQRIRRQASDAGLLGRMT